MLILQIFDDLPIGSAHRLVLLDLDFHEKYPATEHSTSRRCIQVPRVSTRPALLRLTGLSTHCARSNNACLVWHNNALLQAQGVAPFDVAHGDYFRIAVPPWKRAPAAFSTGTCVQRVRANPARISYQLPPLGNAQIHDDGMSVVDSYIHEHGPLSLAQVDWDQATLFQMTQRTMPAPAVARNARTDKHNDEVMCKVDDDYQEIRREMQGFGRAAPPTSHFLMDQPFILH